MRRDVSPLATERSDWREVELRLSDLPSACAGEHAWLTAVATVHHALLILCGREGEVELCEHDLETPSEVVFRLAWKTR